MGNVHATSQPPMAASPPLIAPPPPPSKDPVSAPHPGTPGAPPSDSGQTPPPPSNNPGTFEDLHKKCKDVFPQIFEGGKLIISKGLSSHFQVSHTVSMSTFQPTGYRFGGTYVGTKMYGPQEAYPVLIGDTDVSGNMNANIIHQFTERLRTKFVSQIQNSKWLATQFATDYRGDNYTVSCTLGNVDIINESGIAVAQYLQKVSPSLMLGAELLYQYGSTLPGNEMAMLSLAGKYTADKWQLSANCSLAAGGVHLCYYQEIAENLEVGIELETNVRLQESVTTAGYQYEIPNAGMTFRGQLDTNWCVGAILEKKLLPFPFTFALSGYANHTKSQYRFGVGLIVG
ncbi:TOM40 [Acanthosepion pharaonis]|uniref:TOM40 n=1 Tax=Acanthosepion pharaonis TaxID=158019 RepID=A0A812CGL5_ACAPH|nr:TOM40 [Sepia pharaonis]